MAARHVAARLGRVVWGHSIARENGSATWHKSTPLQMLNLSPHTEPSAGARCASAQPISATLAT